MTAQSFSLSAPASVPLSSLRESAYRGDLQHKLDLHRLFDNCSDPQFLVLLTATSQAHYLRSHRADLVPPPNPNGTPPSDHTVATFFEHYYFVDNSFASRYLTWVRSTGHLV